VGLGAGGGITTGTRNTCIGDDAGNVITTATRSIAIGHLAMGVTAVTGTGNVAIGFQTGYAMLAGAENVMIGEYAGNAITSGSRNTCVGINSGKATTTAVDNVFLGTQAGTYEVGTTTGSYNTIVGGYCHTSAVDSIQQIVMGHNVTGNGDNTLCFGNATTDSSIAFGATSITAPSDQRYKEEIADATAGLSFIKDLRPVTFKWKKEKDVPSDHPAYVEGSDKRVMESNGETNHGFIAQEVKAVIDNHPEIKDGFAMWSEQGLDENGNSTGGRQRLGDGALIPILVKAIQELEARLAVLEG
jgi:trimeric autotransporter adhesin